MADISALPKSVELMFAKIDPPSGADHTKSPVVICHGIFGGKDSWVEIGAKIAEKTKRTVYCLDARDHGESPWTNEFHFRAMISDTVQFLNKHKIEKAIMIGHSLGGLAFSRLATLFPNIVEKLIIVDIHPKKQSSSNVDSAEGTKMVNLLGGLLKQTIEKIRSEKMDLETAKQSLDEMLKPYIKVDSNRKGYCNKLTVRNGQIDWKFNLKILIEFMQTIASRIREDITPRYAGPVLEVYGSDSIFIAKEDCESILELLPNTRFERIEGADHVLHTTHPDKFIQVVVPFINE